METQRTGPAGEKLDTARHRALGTASRASILRLVRDADTGLTPADVAARAGLHLSTVRAHLDRLVDAGLLVKARASAGLPGRPAWRYRAAAPEPAPGPYRSLTTALLDHLAATDGVAGAIATGDTWGRTLAASVTGAGQATPDQPVDQPMNVVLRVLDRLGFDPRRTASSSANGADDTAVVLLDTCPFLELVGPHPDLVCALHAGMIRSVLRTAGAPDGEAVLEPLGAPTACVARLRLRSPAARGASTPATGRRPGNQRPTRLP